jgi:hypothetical protein
MNSFVLVLLLAQAAAGAVNAGPKYQQADDKIVCKLVTEVGTKIATRICRTHAEWEQMYKDTQEDLSTSRNKQVGCNQAFCQ